MSSTEKQEMFDRQMEEMGFDLLVVPKNGHAVVVSYHKAQVVLSLGQETTDLLRDKFKKEN